MISMDLQDALVAFVTKELDGLHYRDKAGKLVPVHVFKQYMPRGKQMRVKRTSDESALSDMTEQTAKNFPCVLVKILESRDYEQEHMSQIDVSLVAGIYDDSPDNQGYRDVLDILERLRLPLLEKRFLEKKFRLMFRGNDRAFAMRMELPDEQAWPIYVGALTMTFEAIRPVMTPPPDFNF